MDDRSRTHLDIVVGLAVMLGLALLAAGLMATYGWDVKRAAEAACDERVAAASVWTSCTVQHSWPTASGDVLYTLVCSREDD